VLPVGTRCAAGRLSLSGLITPFGSAVAQSNSVESQRGSVSDSAAYNDEVTGWAAWGRHLAAVALVAGLVAGTVVWQTDDTWPLAQMRMFPGGEESDVVILAITGVRTDGKQVELPPSAFHMKRADIEGQLPRVLARPRMLRDLIAAYNREVESGARLRALILTQREAVREADGEPRWVERELVRWPR
jgi:hypothetical protein